MPIYVWREDGVGGSGSAYTAVALLTPNEDQVTRRRGRSQFLGLAATYVALYHQRTHRTHRTPVHTPNTHPADSLPPQTIHPYTHSSTREATTPAPHTRATHQQRAPNNTRPRHQFRSPTPPPSQHHPDTPHDTTTTQPIAPGRPSKLRLAMHHHKC